MNESAVISGLGLITPLGNSVGEVWHALLVGEFIRDHSRVRLEDDGETARTESPCHGRVHALALHAAKEAIGAAGWTRQLMGDPSTALVVGTSKGPVESWLTEAPILQTGLAEVATRLAQNLGHGIGPRTTLSSACASGLHALIHAVLLLRSGVAQRALVVAAEASVHPLFIGSFKRLAVLPREGSGCRPFDRDRDGFLISEAGAAICIERCAEEVIPNGSVLIDRMAIGGDATHLTGSDPDGRTLRRLLKQVIAGNQIQLVHAHATGTALNDPIELDAIEATLPAETITLPHIYSHKGAIGHSLGASGLVSVVLNCMSHRNGIIPPNVQTANPLKICNATISTGKVIRPVRRSIAFAAGFGGAMGAVALVSNA